ncbi:MAG: PASTA domain-containing protein [Acidobacteriota bacterium]|nr:PASTA domain-containing protein [Acidobacteriota bacterium]
MGFVKNGVSAVGKLFVVLTLFVTFLIGMFGVIYVQLKGDEVAIPKVVGKNFNDGREDLSDVGLRIKKIATRYSNEEPNTILEQRPRAGTTAKSGLMISVVVSEKNPDGSELPVKIKDDEAVIGEIEQQPELKIDKQKPKAKSKKEDPKTRDVMKEKDETEKPSSETDKPATGEPATGNDPVPKAEPKPNEAKPPAVPAKPAPSAPPKPKDDPKKPNTSGDVRNRKVDQSV